MLFAISFNVASEGCSVRLKGLDQVFVIGRGRKGRVHKLSRFSRTRVSLVLAGLYRNLRP